MLKPAHSFALFLTFFLSGRVFAGNTTCASGQLDWYTSVVGETPCMTYQRLRQICNGDYQVGAFRSRNPGDNCDDQVSGCCCNTIAFELSMLCMNCQQDPLPGDQVGIDAAPGTYTEYRGNCGAGTNNSLPSDIQAAVCNENIRLDNYLYGGWGDGSFFYVYTRENAEKDHAANNNNTFTHCPNQKAPVETTSSTTTTTTTSSSTSTSHTQPPTQVTGGGVAPVSQPNTSVDTVAVSGASSHAGPTTTTTGTATSGSSAPATSGQLDSSAVGTTSSQTTSDGSNQVAAASSAVSDNAASHSTSSKAAIIGGVVGVGAVLLVVVLGFLLWRCRTRRTQRHVPTLGIQDISDDLSVQVHSDRNRPFEPADREDPFRTFIGPNSSASHPYTDASPSGVPSAWSAYSSAIPRSTPTHEEPMRHTDAGVTVPLFLSPSGGLPPAYRSWENSSSDGSVPVGNSQESVSNAESELTAARSPLVRTLSQKEPLP